jgi:hypothetical protein
LSVRKFAIGLIVLGALLVLYMGYARIGGTPPPGLSVPEPLPIPAAATAREPNARGGRIGTTEVIAIEQTRFFHRDAGGRIDREFGFEVILHKQADRWRFTNPYMKLFLSKLQCHVTADTGEVQVQTAFKQLVPNDALFQGNVVIHIIPPKRNDPRECFIYLDDVTFVAEKSLFSSTGPVQFVSRSAVLEGVGMELIYDSLQSRLELFRIISLKSLRMRSADAALFSGDKENARRERRVTGEQPAVAAQGGPGVAPPAASPTLYECILRRDVKIDTPQRVVIAQDLLAIKDIPWIHSGEGGQDADRPAQPPEPNVLETPPAPAPGALDTNASRQLAFDAMPANAFDIVVTCSGGLVVVPADASSRYVDANDVASPQGNTPSLDARSSREQAMARRIEYNARTGDAAFVGPVQMTAPLDPNILAGPTRVDARPGRPEPRRAQANGGRPMPLTITAQNAVRYLSASNRVVFEGHCVAAADKADPNIEQSFTLSAPTFALDLMQDANAPADQKVQGKAIALKRFSTGGGPASIVVRRRAGELAAADKGKLLGWTRIRASQMEYDAAGRLFRARGPGELRLNNAQGSSLDPNFEELRAGRSPTRDVSGERGRSSRRPRQADPNTFGFDQPCYAFLRDFDLLTFDSDTNEIVVAAESQPILIDYIPVIDGKYGQHIQGDAGHLDLILRRTDAGRMEIASLVASRGVTYEDQTKQFVGGTLTYDRRTSLVKVIGSDTQPCFFNGALVDQIEMDAATSALKTQLRAPSIFQGKR